MESQPIPIKCPCISVEESAFDQTQEVEASHQKRWLCNELVWELCKKVPTVETSDRILLTALNIYAYLAPKFSKKLIYRDAIVFLKAKLKAKKNIYIRIDDLAQNESNPNVVINQKQSNEKFELETCHLRVQIWTLNYSRNRIHISDYDGQFVKAHLLYFLHLIAPLLQPIQLYLSYELSRIPIARLIRFMSTQSDWIDSIALWNYHFNWEPIYGALRKYNKLEIYFDSISPICVPKMIQWLTSSNNNGQPKKYLFLGQSGLNDAVAPLVDELKKEFARATSKSRFVVCLKLWKYFGEFTLCNESTGERLEMRLKKIADGRYFNVLSRCPDNGMDVNENDCAQLDTFTEINLC